MRVFRHPFVVLIFASAIGPMSAIETRAAVEALPTGGREVYRLAIAQAGPKHVIIGSTWDNRLCAFDADGKHRWDTSLDGFAYDLCCADLDGDHVDEILTAGADGAIGCYSSTDGSPRWKHTMPAPVLQVTVARLDGRSPVVVAGGISREILVLSPDGKPLRSIATEARLGGTAVRMLRAGDFDGDGNDEVAFQGLRGQPMEVRFLAGAALDPLPAAGPRNGLRTANGAVADIGGDGAEELLLGRDVLSLKGGAAGNVRRLATLPEEPKTKSYDSHYRMRDLAAGNLVGGPEAEIAIIDAMDIQLCTGAGKVLGSAHAPISFSDVAFLPGSPRGSIVLGSGLGGDDNLYRVSFAEGWEGEVATLNPSGQRKAVEANLRQIADAAKAWQGEPMAGAGGPYDVIVSHHMWVERTSLETVDAWIEEVRSYAAHFPYPRLRFSTCFWPGEQLPLKRPDGKTWSHDKRLSHDLTREQIVEAARKFERARCPFWVQVGHGCSPHLSVDSVAAVLDAAPEMCLGFVSAEDEQAGEMAYYFRHQICPILEMCLKRGKRFIPRNKNVWWCHWPADPALREMIFDGRYRSVLLPCVEDSNSRTSDAQLAARVGLWLDGQVDDWASRCSADWFSFNRAWEWEAVLTGHPHLRYYVSQALLGARVFMMLSGERERGSGRWTSVGSQGVVPFLHMLGRGAITPPERDQMKSVSPVLLNIDAPSERFVRHGANGHGYQVWNADGTDTRPWAFDRLDCYWGMAPLPPTDISTYLWGRARRSADQIPMNSPHGLVCILPGPAPRSASPWTTIWTTDGDRLSKGGKTFSLESAGRAIETDLKSGMAALPFRVEGHVFWQIASQGKNRFVACLMDPGWVDPSDRTAILRAHVPGGWTASDRMTGRALGKVGEGLNLTVRAGTFLLIDLRREHE